MSANFRQGQIQCRLLTADFVICIHHMVAFRMHCAGSITAAVKHMLWNYIRHCRMLTDAFPLSASMYNNIIGSSSLNLVSFFGPNSLVIAWRR